MLEAIAIITAAASAVYAVLVLYVWLREDAEMFRPHPSEHRADAAHLTIPASDGTPLSAVHLEAVQPVATVLYLHGNAEDLGDIRPFLEEMRDHGLSVLSFDYRGYGLTPGCPREGNVYADTAAAFSYLTEKLGLDARRIVVYGRSLGGGPAADLASRERVGGLVLEGTFLSAFRVATWFRLLPWDRFPIAPKLARVGCPVLVIHGTEDATISFAHGRRLFELARPPKEKLWLEGAGHNDLPQVAGPAYWEALCGFVRRAVR